MRSAILSVCAVVLCACAFDWRLYTIPSLPYPDEPAGVSIPTPVEVTAAPTPVAPTPAPATPAPPAPTRAAPVVTMRASVTAPASTVATPAPCAATWFCYPRLGIAGPIVPYGDCLGSTDIGEGIRSFTCISPFYLMGHAYTQFGAITGWRAGDIVQAHGRRFVISSASVQRSCERPIGTAPLSLQTSLSLDVCGPVLVVRGVAL